MTYQHRTLAAGRWGKFNLITQMAHIGSEVIRAINWSTKKRSDYAFQATDRALELLSLTIDDIKNIDRLRELTRLYECLVDYFYGENNYKSDQKKLINYFMAFNYAARLKKE